jgi:hypothetical protein
MPHPRIYALDRMGYFEFMSTEHFGLRVEIVDVD